MRPCISADGCSSAPVFPPMPFAVCRRSPAHQPQIPSPATRGRLLHFRLHLARLTGVAPSHCCVPDRTPRCCLRSRFVRFSRLGCRCPASSKPGRRCPTSSRPGRCRCPTSSRLGRCRRPASSRPSRCHPTTSSPTLAAASPEGSVFSVGPGHHRSRRLAGCPRLSLTTEGPVRFSPPVAPQACPLRPTADLRGSRGCSCSRVLILCETDTVSVWT